MDQQPNEHQRVVTTSYIAGMGGLMAMTEVPQQGAPTLTGPPALTQLVDISEAKIVYIQGGPGAGKSTVARKLVQNFGGIHLEPDSLVRRFIELDTSPQAMILRLRGNPAEVPDQVPLEILKNEIARHMAQGHGLFFIENFPKNCNQFYDLERLFGQQVIISLVVSDAVLFRRFMRTPYRSTEKVSLVRDFMAHKTVFLGQDIGFLNSTLYGEGVVEVNADQELEAYYPLLDQLVKIVIDTPKKRVEAGGPFKRRRL